ncbi:MAG TPA: DUF2017 domain-containing protein [Mycobacteriales bacterium]|nr:DUF2017 domain-containing protein [Mycobacteriales bacterium]
MGSVRRKGAVVRVGLAEDEVVLLASLASGVMQLLGGPAPTASDDPVESLLAMPATAVDAPQDPVLARLLPDAYRDDDAAAGEFRRLMDGDLRAQKRGALQRMLDDLAGAGVRKGGELRFELDDEAAQQWLYATNDIRLVLGTTLGVTEDMAADRATLEPGSPRDVQLMVYDWMTWLQNAVVEAVMR